MPELLDAIIRRCREAPSSPVTPTCSGAQFLERMHSLRSELQRRGVRPGVRVGIGMGHCTELLVALAATWAAGGSFVPVDLHEASRRWRQILVDSGTTMLLAAGNPVLPAAHRKTSAANVTVMDLDTEDVGEVSAEQWQDEAYVIFTSGSSGRPKGVSVGHGSIAGYVRTVCEVLDIPDGGMTFPAQLPPTFDASLTSLLVPLASGNTVVPINDPISATRGLGLLLRQCSEPVLVKTTPSQVRLLSGFLSRDETARLRGIFVIGGEQLRFEDIAWLRHSELVSIVNEYGPTEATVGCCAYRVAESDPAEGAVPIGYPYPGAILSIDGDGTEGELMISGPMVAHGYVNQPSDRFQVRDGMPCYRTGDIVYADTAGLHFRGRADDQVKIDGFRVELGEVEHALRSAADGSPAAALMIDGSLVGVVQRPAGTLGNASAIAGRMHNLVPAYMRPARIYLVDELPVTQHGKYDRACLASTLCHIQAQDFGAAPPPNTQYLAGLVQPLWERMLGTQVTGDTDFFASGAHSVTALKMIGNLSSRLGRSVPLSLIFDHPTLSGFVMALAESVPHPTGREKSETEPYRGQSPAATQLAILAAETIAPREAAFTVASAIRVRGITDWAKLIAGATGTLAGHVVFTWRFELDSAHNVVASQVPHPSGRTFSVEVTDLSQLGSRAAHEQALNWINEHRRRPIHLLGNDDRPTTRMKIFRTGDHTADGETAITALITHHALVDELSADLIWAETISNASRSGPLPSLDSRYGQWAQESMSGPGRARAHEMAAGLSRYLTSGHLSGLALPAPDNGQSSQDDASAGFEISAELGRDLKLAAGRWSVPIHALYGSAVVRVLGTAAKEGRFAIYMPLTLRRSPDDFTTVGCFVTSLPVLAQVFPGETAAETARRWNRSVGTTMDNAAADPGELARILQDAAPGWAASPMVSLAFETTAKGPTGSLEWEPLALDSGPSKHDVAIFINIDRKCSAQGRIIWRQGAVSSRYAVGLCDAIVAELEASCHHQYPESPPSGRSAKSESPRRTSSPAADTGEHSTSNRMTSADLADLASSVLGRRVAPDDDLFQAGATSLDLTRIIAAIHRQYRIRIRAVDIFDCPTPATLSAAVASLTSPE